MTIPRPLVGPALWGFGAGLLMLSFPSALLAALVIALVAAVMRWPRVAAFAGAAGATSALILSPYWVTCEVGSPERMCADFGTLTVIAALIAVVGIATAGLTSRSLRT